MDEVRDVVTGANHRLLHQMHYINAFNGNDSDKK